VDHPGLLLMMYPRPVFVAAAVLDFFPIEGTRKSFREVEALYAAFGHADRIAMHEGYHDHQYSPENQEAAMEFLDHFNRMPARHELAPVKELEDTTLQCTRTGQVMLDFNDARSLMDEIHDYYELHKSEHQTLKQLYFSEMRPPVEKWTVGEYRGTLPSQSEIRWQSLGSTQISDVTIERFLLRHSRCLEMPLLWIHKSGQQHRPVLLWFRRDGKATASDWPSLATQLNEGYDIVTFDFRGLGETRMPFKAESPDDPALAKRSYDEAYFSPISGVLADYVYNSVLTGRPYFLQLMDDVAIAARFAREHLGADGQLTIVEEDDSPTVASAAAEILPNLKLHQTEYGLKWSEVVEQKRELWPIETLLPGGAYMH
jgi:hypothetical protein